MSKEKFMDFIGTASYPKLQESSRDMGENLPDGDLKNKLEACQGMYVLNVYISDEEKKKMIADGVPNKGMAGQLFKEDNDGDKFYKCTRKHFNPRFTDKETGEKGVVMGPPKVLKEVDGQNVEWDWEEDGLIGNGSKVKVRISVWDDKLVEIKAVKVLEHVPFESTSGSTDDM